MPNFIHEITIEPNWDKLREEIRTAIPAITGMIERPRQAPQVSEIEVEHDGSVTPQQIDSILAAHNPATLTSEQQKAIARTLMLSDAKNYLSNQLQAANPNVQTIFNTVKAYVDNNPTLAQMLSNQIALFNTAYGVTINPAGATAADRTRYLICCQLVLATIA